MGDGIFGYGIIGCGWVASAHAWGVAASADRDVRLVAVSDPDIGRAEELAERFNVDATYESYAELLKRDDILAVSVCVPDFLHRQIVIDCARAGKHVLCEKPLAMNVAESDEMLSACEAEEVALGLIMNHRYAPDNIRTRHALASRAIGNQLIGSVVHSSGLSGPPEGSPWRGKATRAAGGVLSTQAIHFLDLLLWFMGRVRSVEGLKDTLKLKGQDHEDTAVLALKFESGALATLAATSGSPIMDDFTGTRIEVHGTDGWLVLEGDVLRRFEGSEGFALPEVQLPPVPEGANEILFGLGHVYEVMDFVEAVRAGRRAPIPGADGRHLMAVIEAAYRSTREHEEVEVEGPPLGYDAESPAGSLLNPGHRG